MNQPDPSNDFNRRDFIKGSSFATLMTMMGGVPLFAQDKPAGGAAPTAYSADKKAGPPVNCALIGCGLWGREILKSLARIPGANVSTICDTYEPYLRRAAEYAPKAAPVTDFETVLENKEIKAVLIATPSHLHREVVLAALKAGKHVYCEAPLASSVDDARAIASTAKVSPKSHFQSGLSLRSDAQRKFLLDFIRAGAIGSPVMARSQWHKKESWRRTAVNAEREAAINWRLRKATSPGLAGEIGIHLFDSAAWFLNMRPVSVTGFGSIMQWNDGRDVPDTIQVVLEFANGVRLTHDCTLANSFDSEYEMLFGLDAAVMLRGNKAWMFKEVEAPLLGWEVYAQKDIFYQETGIALVANATKSTKPQEKTGEDIAVTSAPLFVALEAFITNADIHQTGVEDFASNFDINDTAALQEYLVTLQKTKAPHAGWQEGLDATITALKATESISTGKKIVFEKEWFQV